MVNLLIIFCAKYLIALPVVVALVYLYVARRRVKRKLLLLSAISLPLAYIVGQLTEHLYYNARPFVEKGIEPLVAHAANNGFPSDHVLFAGTIASLIFVFNRPLGILLWILALVIGIARIAAQVHHGIDIIASALIAVAVVSGVYVSIRNANWYRG